MADTTPMFAALDAGDLTAERLCRETWYLGAPNEHPRAYHVKFRPNGVIAGWDNADDRSWRLDGGRLLFLDRYDRCTVAFDDVAAMNGGLELLGRPTEAATDRQPRLLRLREPIAELRPSAPDDLQMRSRPTRRKRRNLIVLRANEQSLHTGWARDIADDDRNWDLCVSFYGNPDNFGRDDYAEYQVLQHANRKYLAAYDLFYDSSPLWDYERIAFPDDDLATTWKSLNELFVICREFDLDLAQPSLTGYITHPITRPDPAYVLRFTSFVEVIAPVFSQAALRICAPTFSGTVSGYGLDHIWPKLLGEPRHRMAIIDQVSMEHTRPPATSYNMEDAMAEAWAFQMRYSAYLNVSDYGGILKERIDRLGKW